MKSRSKTVVSFVLILVLAILAASCTASEQTEETEEEKKISGTLTIARNDSYQEIMERIVRRVEGNYPMMEIVFTEEREDADILITDNMSAAIRDKRANLSDFYQQKQSMMIDELALRQDENVIGIPIFLKMSSFWCDRMHYRMSGNEIPYSLSGLQMLHQKTKKGIVTKDYESVFWNVTAVYYIKAGGLKEELLSGNFKREPMKTALKKTRELFQTGMLTMEEDAKEAFLAGKTFFYLADVGEIASCRYDLSPKSEVTFAQGLLCEDGEDPICVLRAEYVTVNRNADMELVQIFLEETFQNDTLTSAVREFNIPLACRMLYDSNTVPEFFSRVYRGLSDPDLTILYLPCRMEPDREAGLYQKLSKLTDEKCSIDKILDDLYKK